MRPLLLAILLLAAAVPGLAQDADAIARTRAAILKLLEQRPDDATLHFFLARTEAANGDARAATGELEKAEKLGDGFLPPRDGFEKVWDDPGFQAGRQRMEAKLPRLDFAPIAIELEDRGLVPEGIAYDAPSKNFFMGSIAKHKIVRIDAEGNVNDFEANIDGMDSVLGVAVDSPRRILYAVSTSAITAEGRKNRRNAIFAFDVDNGRLAAPDRDCSRRHRLERRGRGARRARVHHRLGKRRGVRGEPDRRAQDAGEGPASCAAATTSARHHPTQPCSTWRTARGLP